jgi:DNA modification methylase
LENIALLGNTNKNKVQSKDLAIHNWYQFVLGYPPHLVTHYIEKFELYKSDILLDPFCGTGTTPVEAFKSGFSCYGLEANPIAVFASKVKAYKEYDSGELRKYLAYIYCSIQASYARHKISEPQKELFGYKARLMPVTVGEIEDLPEEQKKLIPKGFICPRPLLKVLIIKEIIRRIEDEAARNFFLLALASFIVKIAGNIGFGPEIYRKKPKGDIESLANFARISECMISDVENTRTPGWAQIIAGDAREMGKYLSPGLLSKVNCVVTSPPYPNEKDYTRSTRLESVLLDFVHGTRGLREIKENLLRSNSRNVFVSDKDCEHIKDFSRITSIAEEIEEKRLSLKKSSGFEKHYHKIVLHYFGGMHRHLRTLKPFLAEGCKLAYVLGDQMSFFRILIPTAELLGEVAESLGYTVKEIELWRTRISTATKMEIKENVLILENK